MEKSYPVLKPIYDTGLILENLKSVLESNWTGDGGFTEIFENEWSQYTGYKNSIYTNSCTAALHLALLIIKDKFPQRKKVIVPDITFISTASVVLQSSLELVLCDIDETLCMNSHSLKELIDKDTLGVIYVGIGGNTSNLRKINNLCKSNEVPLIIDAAHMAGGKLDSKTKPHLGEFAEFVCYSFQAVKNLGIADSGMICFQNNNYIEQVSKYRWLGIDKTTFKRTKENLKNSYKWEYDIDRLGYKYNGNALIASCCLSILPSLDKTNLYRRKLRQNYLKSLKEIKGVTSINHENEKYTSGHLFQILLEKGINSEIRNQLISKLNKYKIFPGVHYKAISTFTFYKRFSRNLKKSKFISNRIISLPCHLDINSIDIEFIVEKINKEIS